MSRDRFVEERLPGAEALPEYFDAPLNAGDVLKCGIYRGGEFGAYDEFDPWSRVFWNPETGEFVTGGTIEFVLNFIAGEEGLAQTAEWYRREGWL